MKSLWKLPDVENMTTPLRMLREQAAALTEDTRGALKGSVTNMQQAESTVLQLIITVPALNNYRYSVLRYEQPVILYPGTMQSGALNIAIQIQNEEQFVAALDRIITSDQISRVLKGLLAQANTRE